MYLTGIVWLDLLMNIISLFMIVVALVCGVVSNRKQERERKMRYAEYERRSGN